IYYADKSLSMSGTTDSLRLEIYLIRAEAFRLKGTLEGFSENLKLSRDLNKTVKDARAEMTIANLSGLYFWKVAQFDSAIYYFFDVREKAKVLRDTIGIIKSYNNL